MNTESKKTGIELITQAEKAGVVLTVDSKGQLRADGLDDASPELRRLILSNEHRIVESFIVLATIRLSRMGFMDNQPNHLLWLVRESIAASEGRAQQETIELEEPATTAK